MPSPLSLQKPAPGAGVEGFLVVVVPSGLVVVVVVTEGFLVVVTGPGGGASVRG